jgi:hypothetical protein
VTPDELPLAARELFERIIGLAERVAACSARDLTARRVPSEATKRAANRAADAVVELMQSAGLSHMTPNMARAAQAGAYIAFAAGGTVARRWEQPAWWCPTCEVGVELGEEAWQGSIAPSPGTLPICHPCGSKLEAFGLPES